jgi:hypothetical protein
LYHRVALAPDQPVKCGEPSGPSRRKRVDALNGDAVDVIVEDSPWIREVAIATLLAVGLSGSSVTRADGARDGTGSLHRLFDFNDAHQRRPALILNTITGNP